MFCLQMLDGKTSGELAWSRCRNGLEYGEPPKVAEMQGLAFVAANILERSGAKTRKSHLHCRGLRLE